MKADIKEVESIARRHGMSRKQRREFGDYIHEKKQSGEGGSKPNGDFTYQELDQLAREFLGGK